MKVLISGGGTGGHVFPSLAIADEIKKRDCSNEVLFIGTLKGLESRIVPSRGYRFEAVGGAPVSGGGVTKAVSGAFSTLSGVVKSFFILKKFRPDVAVGMGGYASFPAIAAARALGVPVAICEQNSVSGLANRVLGRIARRVFLSFSPPRGLSAAPFAPGKVRVVGNPVRPAMVAAARARKPGCFPQSAVRTIFVLGGSLGARALNRFIPDGIAEFKRQTGRDVRVIHQTGSHGAREVAAAYKSAGVGAQVFDFNPEIADLYAVSDLVISRAGAGAVAEIALFSRPSILVPYPFAADGHQSANAAMMGEAGAAAVIEEKNLSQKTVAETLERLLNWDTLRTMSRAAAKIAAANAAARIVDEMEIIASESK